MSETAKAPTTPAKPPPEYTKQEFLEFERSKAHKAADKSHNCVGATNNLCPCKGCATPRALSAASEEWDSDRGAKAKESLVAEFGPKQEPKQ